MKNIKSISTLALGAALFAASVAPQSAIARVAKMQNVTVTINGQGFSPALVNVKAGQKVRLTFVSKEGSCANDFTIPALKRSLSVKPGQKKTVVFTPKKGQSIAFACGMNMFKGKVTAK